MKKLAVVFIAAACLAAPVQAMAQTKEAPAMESKKATAEAWPAEKVLTIAGGAIVGVIAADILLPGIMMKEAIGVIGGTVLGYYWYTNELPQPMMTRKVSDTDGIAKVIKTTM